MASARSPLTWTTVIGMEVAMAFLALTPSASSSAGVYDSSITPATLPWNTYNYCNAPHVNAKHYEPPRGAELVWVNMLMRHHKRTPDNLYPNENALNPKDGWDCTDFIQYSYGDRSGHGAGGVVANVWHETFIPATHPFLRQIWNGTCDQGQLTRGGLEDAIKHGKDFWSVYHDRLHFLNKVDESEIWIRTSTETRTYQVTGGLLYGMDPASAQRSFKVHTQPSSIDSWVPKYSCPNADAIRNNYQSVSAWTDHLHSNQDLQDRLDLMLGTAGLSAWSSWYDHFFDTFTSRTCHGHSLPCNAAGQCVSQADADRVFAIGDFEYNYIWNAAEGASRYVQLQYGVFFFELAASFKAFADGGDKHKVRLYVGHDASMIRLASGLGIGKTKSLRWPALGSEIVLEVWRKDHSNFVRVMHEGTPVPTLEWVPFNDFVAALESQVPENLYDACTKTS